MLQDAATPDAAQIVRLMDGSILLGKSISVADGRLSIDDTRLGAIDVATPNVVDIAVGNSLFDALGQVAPTRVEGPLMDYSIDGTTTVAPMALLGVNVGRGIGQRPGVSLSWDVAGKYKSVIAKAGVPLGVVPMHRLQFVVLADGKEVFRSKPQTSVDDPTPIGVNLTDVKTLTLRVDAPDPLAPGAVGLWGDPVLVKDKAAAN